MIITLKIDLERSGNLFHELMHNEAVEIIEIKSNPKAVIVVGPCKPSFSDLRNEIEIIRSVADHATMPDEMEKDWFDDSKYWYNLDILRLSRNFLMTFPEPFIKRLFNRKCFMVLKDFRNIRRCYNF